MIRACDLVLLCVGVCFSESGLRSRGSYVRDGFKFLAHVADLLPAQTEHSVNVAELDLLEELWSGRQAIVKSKAARHLGSRRQSALCARLESLSHSFVRNAQ
jgi:hypothetical protein